MTHIYRFAFTLTCLCLVPPIRVHLRMMYWSHQQLLLAFMRQSGFMAKLVADPSLPKATGLYSHRSKRVYQAAACQR